METQMVLVLKAHVVDAHYVRLNVETSDGGDAGQLVFPRRDWDATYGEIAEGAEAVMVLEQTITIA